MGKVTKEVDQGGGDKLIVKYEDSPEMHKKVFDAVIAFCFKHESFAGEVMCQSDDPSIEAVYHLAHIADDVIEFETEWVDGD